MSGTFSYTGGYYGTTGTNEVHFETNTAGVTISPTEIRVPPPMQIFTPAVGMYLCAKHPYFLHPERHCILKGKVYRVEHIQGSGRMKLDCENGPTCGCYWLPYVESFEIVEEEVIDVALKKAEEEHNQSVPLPDPKTVLDFFK